ncbi:MULTISPECIES: hypothetical protein [Oxalobacteraceae]|jgi:hypothetical protein|uniref:hypothetical protein n=1 Tax=Oxalobacteraceae TaxID=75682 RepID=UPI0010A31050|nr:MULTISPECIES: hypothetical protein [Oxalobacteraceae]
MSACVVAGAVLLSGCASVYVDTATKAVPLSEMKKVAQPKPVRLVFEFQSKGAPNARATDFLKETVAEQVKTSGMFSAIDSTSPDDAILNVTLNNVPLTEDAASKGFVTGLTFGLAGSAVTDGYICTVSYLAPGKTQPVTKTARHAIHTVLGNANAPVNAVKSENLEVAVRTMTKDVLSNALRDLSHDAAFN